MQECEVRQFCRFFRRQPVHSRCGRAAAERRKGSPLGGVPRNDQSNNGCVTGAQRSFDCLQQSLSGRPLASDEEIHFGGAKGAESRACRNLSMLAVTSFVLGLSVF